MSCNEGFKSLKTEDMMKALHRAARMAREEARLHGTALVSWQDGKLVKKYVPPKREKKRA